MIVDPASENRCFHGHRPGLRKRLHPAVQFPAGCSDLAFLVNLTAGIFDAITDRLLVNIEPDVIHNVYEEPPWLLSESTFPLSSAFSTPRAPPGLSIQTIHPESSDCLQRAAQDYNCAHPCLLPLAQD